jgi:hypothetical protein
VLLFVPTFTLDQMVVPRVLVSSLLNPQMMLAMQFNNSMAMTGKAAPSRFVKIDLLDQLGLEDAADSVVVEALGVVLEVVVDSVLAVASEVASAAVVVMEAVASEVGLRVGLMEELAQLLQHPIRSLTMLLLARREARRSMSET